MKTRYTTEELKGLRAQPEDSCPYLNNIIQNIQLMINNSDSSYSENILLNLEKAFEVISELDDWDKSWKESFSVLDKKDDFVIIAELEKDKFKKINPIKLKEEFLTIFNDEFIGMIDDLSFNKKDVELQVSDEDMKINKLFINMKKVDLHDVIEKIREYASSKRAYTNYMKSAYKNYSVSNNINDIIQPSELIDEQIKPHEKNDIYNLGVILSDQSINKLSRDNIINDIELVLVEKMDDKNKTELIIDAINNAGFNKISYYKSLSDFSQGKGYKTERIKNIQSLKMKNK